MAGCDLAAYSNLFAGPFTVGGSNTDEQHVFDLCAGDFVVSVVLDSTWANGTTQECDLEVRFINWNIAGTFSYFAYVYGDGGADTTVTRGLGRDDVFLPIDETSGLTKPVEGDTLELDVSGTRTGSATVAMKYNGVEMFSGVDTPDDTEWASVEVYVHYANGITISDFAVDATADVTPPLGTMFLPPSFGRIPTTVPKGFPQYDGVSNALMRNFRPRQEGTNVYYTSEGEVTETDPDSVNLFWDKTQGTPYVVYTFWGSTDAPYEVTTAQAQALSDAGYTLT